MTELEYYKLDPTGNMTLIVKTPVPRDRQKKTAVMLMGRFRDVEQVGFLEKPADGSAVLRLQMMGGEFCGNATVSAAALYAYRHGLSDGTVRLEISGMPEPMDVDITAAGDGYYLGSVMMPPPTGTEYREFDGKTLPVVNFSGISHIISEKLLKRDEAEAGIKKWCRALCAEALGVMLIDGDKLSPLVYVASTDTSVWENSCASGSTAAAAFFTRRAGMSGEYRFEQPGGVLSVSTAISDSGEMRLRLNAGVRMAGSGSVMTYAINSED